MALPKLFVSLVSLVGCIFTLIKIHNQLGASNELAGHVEKCSSKNVTIRLSVDGSPVFGISRVVSVRLQLATENC